VSSRAARAALVAVGAQVTTAITERGTTAATHTGVAALRGENSGSRFNGGLSPALGIRDAPVGASRSGRSGVVSLAGRSAAQRAGSVNPTGDRFRDLSFFTVDRRTIGKSAIADGGSTSSSRRSLCSFRDPRVDDCLDDKGAAPRTGQPTIAPARERGAPVATWLTLASTGRRPALLTPSDERLQTGSDRPHAVTAHGRCRRSACPGFGPLARSARFRVLDRATASDFEDRTAPGPTRRRAAACRSLRESERVW